MVYNISIIKYAHNLSHSPIPLHRLEPTHWKSESEPYRSYPYIFF